MLKISNEYFQRLVSSDDAAESLSRLSSFWAPRLTKAQAPFSQLSPAERNVQLLLNYSGEVGNGGHLQYFLNTRIDEIDATSAALRDMAFHDNYEILRTALSALPPLPDGWEQKEQVIAAISPERLETLTRADMAFFQLLPSIDPCCLSYLRSNQDQVLISERS